MEIVTAIGSKLGEYLVEGIINQARYLFCFNNIVKDLEHEEDKLKGAQERIKREVEKEGKNTKVIEKEVAKWLKDVEDVTKNVEELKGKIQADKSCLKGWCPNCACRYWLGRKAAKKTITMAELRNDSNNFKEVAHSKPLPGIEFFAPSDFMSCEATELASNQIIEALKDESVKMVGLYGSGGVGKTTLAKNIGNILKQQKFFDDVVVVVISQNPNFKNIQNKLAEELGLNFEEKEEENRAKRLYMRFIDPKSKILIIIDDVWKKHDLKIELGIPVDDNHSGCKILLTTRRQQVCDRMGCKPQISLNSLNSEEGLALLRKYAGIHDDDSSLIEVSKEVASECKGLPLAIAAVGSALRGKDADEWMLVCQKLKEAKLIEVDDVDVDVYACLKLSYDFLKDEKSKFCFMLCSLYPEDHEIDLEDLVRYIVGLDWYVTIEEARSLLHGTIKGLKASSLLLDTGKEGFVKMHDIVRDVAIWTGSKEKTFLSKAGFGLTEWPKDEAIGQYKAISLVETEIKELPKGLVCPNLKILFLGSQFSKMVIPDQFFEGMRKLKIVTIIGGDLSPKSLQYLTDLQVLQLTKCHIRDLAFLGELKTLQILCFKNSSFDEILEEKMYQLSEFKPLEVTGVSLQNLKQLEVAGCNNLTYLFTLSQARTFVHLEEIMVDDCKRLKCIIEAKFDGNEKEKHILREDEITIVLPRLRKLSLSNLPKLISFCSENYYSTWQALQELVLFRCPSLNIIDEVKASVQYLIEELRILRVVGCYNLCDAIPALLKHGLKKLESLDIEGVGGVKVVFQQVEEDIMGGDGYHQVSKLLFPSLKTLRLGELPEVEVLYKDPMRIFTLQNLTTLHVYECSRLTHVLSPTLAQYLLQLEELLIVNCSELEQIIDEDDNCGHIIYDHRQPVSFPKLISLTIYECPKLKRLFHISVAPSLQKLERMHISYCDELEEVFWHEDGADVIMDQQEIVMTQLQSLQLTNLRKLQWIWKAPAHDEITIVLPVLRELSLRDLPNIISLCSENNYAIWHALEELELSNCPLFNISNELEVSGQYLKEKLRRLEVRDCNSLGDAIPALLKHGLKNLEELEIRRVGGVKVVFQQVEEDIIMGGDGHHQVSILLFPSLKTLLLSRLPEVEVLYKDPMHIFTLQNLTTLDVYDCSRLRHVLSPTLARNLLQLEKLDIDNCSELEQIIGEDDNSGHIVYDHRQPPVSFPKLKSLSISGCPKLKRLFHISVAPSLQKLEEMVIKSSYELEEVFWHEDGADVIMDHNKEIVMTQVQRLELRYLPKLQWIWKAPAYDVSLKNLTSVEVEGFNNLTYLFTISQARDLVQLKTLIVSNCERLECLIEAKCDDNTGEKHNLGEGETIIVLPVLTYFSLRNLQNIISFCSENYYSTWQALETLRLYDCRSLNISNELKASGQYLKEKLQSLEVRDCDSLGDAIPALLKHGLKNLEELKIIRVGGVKVVFQQVEEDIIMGGDGHHQGSKLLFPSLKTLWLWQLPEVEVLYKDPEHIFSLQNLTTLDVYDCSRLRHVLSPTLARNLLQLEVLYIGDCSELEQIIDEDDNGEHVVHDHRQPAVVCFPKLAELTVRKCPRLKRLFQISVAPSLQNLKWMYIEDNDELEEVFWHKDGADVIMDHKKIIMTQLWRLELRNLPKLTNLFPVSSQFVCPSLLTEIVEECPKYRTDSKALQHSTGQEEASEEFPSETT